MRLTHRDAWRTYAGGCAAASDRYSYDVDTTVGRYFITPRSDPHNVERHRGYLVQFANTAGALQGGLWQTLHPLTTLPAARRLCQRHMVAHGGAIVYRRS